MPDSDLVRPIRKRSVRHFRDVHGVFEGAMADIATENWWDRAFREEEEGASEQPVGGVMPAHDPETSSSR